MIHKLSVGRRAFLRKTAGGLVLLPFLPMATLGADCDGKSAEEIIMLVLKVIAEAFELYGTIEGSQEVEYTGTTPQAIEMEVELYAGTAADKDKASLVDGSTVVFQLKNGKQVIPFSGLKAKVDGACFIRTAIAGGEMLSADFVVEG